MRARFLLIREKGTPTTCLRSALSFQTTVPVSSSLSASHGSSCLENETTISQVLSEFMRPGSSISFNHIHILCRLEEEENGFKVGLVYSHNYKNDSFSTTRWGPWKGAV